MSKKNEDAETKEKTRKPPRKPKGNTDIRNYFKNKTPTAKPTPDELQDILEESMKLLNSSMNSLSIANALNSNEPFCIKDLDMSSIIIEDTDRVKRDANVDNVNDMSIDISSHQLQESGNFLKTKASDRFTIPHALQENILDDSMGLTHFASQRRKSLENTSIHLENDDDILNFSFNTACKIMSQKETVNKEEKSNVHEYQNEGESIKDNINSNHFTVEENMSEKIENDAFGYNVGKNNYSAATEESTSIILITEDKYVQSINNVVGSLETLDQNMSNVRLNDSPFLRDRMNISADFDVSSKGKFDNLKDMRNNRDFIQTEIDSTNEITDVSERISNNPTLAFNREIKRLSPVLNKDFAYPVEDVSLVEYESQHPEKTHSAKFVAGISQGTSSPRNTQCSYANFSRTNPWTSSPLVGHNPAHVSTNSHPTNVLNVNQQRVKKEENPTTSRVNLDHRFSMKSRNFGVRSPLVESVQRNSDETSTSLNRVQGGCRESSRVTNKILHSEIRKSIDRIEEDISFEEDDFEFDDDEDLSGIIENIVKQR